MRCLDSSRAARPARGATLIELTMVLAIAGLLLLVGMPRAGRALDRIAVRGAAVDVAALFAAARHRAIARSTYAAVLIDARAATMAVRADRDTLLLRRLGATHGVTVSATRDSMAYSPVGLGHGAANLRIVLRRGAAAETVVVSRLGRVRR